MATLPSARTTVSTTAGLPGSGLDLICVLAPVLEGADIQPQLFGNVDAMLEQYGYSEGAEYAALHFAGTRLPVYFVPLPIDVEGAISREDVSGNTGSSVSSVTALAGGVMGEHDGELTVLTGGTVGTDQIVLGYSADASHTVKPIRFGTGTSYTDSQLNLEIELTVGTLTEGETIHTWHGSGPRSASSDWAIARAALAEKLTFFRSALLVGDLQTDTEAQAYLDQLNAYETANDRFIFGRASVYDRLPQAELSHVRVRMMGSPTLTFAEVGLSSDTITRSTGSFIADGFQVGDVITVAGAVASAGANNITGAIASLTATVITLGDTDLINEGPISNCTIVASPGLVFDDSSETITRNRGSFLADGFRVGDVVAVDGTAGGTNDGTGFIVTAVTALVLTLTAGNVDADETISSYDVTLTAGQTKAQWVAEVTDEFESIDAEFRVGLSLGRGRVVSPLSGWSFRRPPSWAASVRSYQHDVHIPTWRKDDGSVGYSLFDTDGNLAEWDERVDGGAACAGRFTAFRTWSNGPAGTYLARDLTRAEDGSIISDGHNADVVNLACATVQAATESVIGRVLVLNDDGTATTAALNTIEAQINSALERALLRDNRGEGQRASKAVWTANADDVLNVAEAVLTGVLDLNLNGTIHSVRTTVRVRSGGQ